jgi:hypothetical protein
MLWIIYLQDKLLFIWIICGEREPSPKRGRGTALAVDEV